MGLPNLHGQGYLAQTYLAQTIKPEAREQDAG